MEYILLDGKAAAKEAKDQVKSQVQDLASKGFAPSLTVVMAGDDPASSVYAEQKRKNCQASGIGFSLVKLPGGAKEEELLGVIGELNRDKSVDGILVEMPLPRHMSNELVQATIDSFKDVDGANPINLGRLMSGLPSLRPCTPQGAMYLLEHYGVDLKGKNAVVVGRSTVVGKPLAMMLLEKNATVTVCHSRTQDLPGRIRQADVVIAAVGRPKMITGSMVKPGAVVVDVGINSTSDGIVGDVDFDSVSKVASAISPVPGGVGPLTIAMLLTNVVKAAKGL